MNVGRTTEGCKKGAETRKKSFYGGKVIEKSIEQSVGKGVVGLSGRFVRWVVHRTVHPIFCYVRIIALRGCLVKGDLTAIPLRAEAEATKGTCICD